MRTAKLVTAFAVLAFVATPLGAQCVSLTATGSAYTETFNILATTGTANTVLPAGWSLNESGSSARNNSAYAASTGSDNAGDVYSLGAASSSDRAFGTLRSGTLVPLVGACFTNNTGAPVTKLAISYRGEQWRLGATGRNDRLDFQYSLTATSLNTGTWTDYNALDFTAPVSAGTAGALDGNANSAAMSATVSDLNIANGATFWIRWSDFDASGADDALGVDEFSLTPLVESGLTVSDLSLAEGDAGTTAFAVTVTLSPAAGPGGVTFDIATADGSALAGSDYIAKSLTGQTIASGSTSYTFTVQVTADTAFEPNETFQVNVTNVTGASVVKGSGTVTIVNDDIVPISQVQGAGNASPYTGAVVAVRGVVTARKSNGFFLQTPDGETDGNPATSEGIFVFTGSPTPAVAAVGALVRVTGTVAEFQPETNSPTLTEISGSPAVSLLAGGGPLPAPIGITAADTNPAGGLYQLERYEGMRVRVDSLTVVAPTDGAVAEASATSTSDGVFYGVITGIARPFREPGIATPDPLPAGAPCCVPFWDSNPERLRVDSDSQRDPAGNPTPDIDVATGAVVANLVGVLDYGFRTYTILPDPGSPHTVSGNNASAVPVPIPLATEFTVASFNMERFYDIVNDAGVSDTALTTAAYEMRKAKASLTIRDVLRLPDILAVQEMENLATLQDLAARVNTDAVAAALPNPAYTAYLVEGNDVGGIDVGFLVKSARVTVGSVTQEGKTATYITPTGASDTLNDRPPLVLTASVAGPGGSAAFPITVIVNHLRSLNGVDDPTDGPRVRAKRRAQAEYLANLVQSRQSTNPAERVVLVGDFNAFPFNDGYVDIIGTVRGAPTPAANVVAASPDLVNPNLVDAADSVAPAQRYSYVFEGSAQTLDHVLLTQTLQPYFAKLAYARVNADFPEIYRGNAARPERLSDHDPAVAYFRFPTADLGITLTSSPAPITGQTVQYTLAVSNTLSDAASNVSISTAVPALATFQSIAAPGWTCQTPAPGASGPVTCAKAALAAGAAEQIVLTVGVKCEVANGASLSVTATIASSTFDPVSANNSATATTSVSNPPPVVSAVTPGKTELWPPNGKMVDVELAYTASDTCGGVNCVVSVASNEPAAANDEPDYEVVNPTLVRLRAKRSGSGGDRIYTITVTCTDSAGNSTIRTATVTVPHSQGNGH